MQKYEIQPNITIQNIVWKIKNARTVQKKKR